MQRLVPYKLAEMVHIIAIFSNLIWIVGERHGCPSEAPYVMSFSLTMPTQSLRPQSTPTVVTCLPRNAVLIRFTYEIILRFTTLKTLTLLVEKSDLHDFKTCADQNSQTRCLRACLAQALQQGLLYRAERLCAPPKELVQRRSHGPPQLPNDTQKHQISEVAPPLGAKVLNSPPDAFTF